MHDWVDDDTNTQISDRLLGRGALPNRTQKSAADQTWLATCLRKSAAMVSIAIQK